MKNFKKIAEEVLINEADAIRNLVNYLNDDFESCLSTILNSKGRVVITGIGKSAIIAQKIVATLNSTGTPSIFMHAADAIHGDLGIVQKDDVVICISKSGNTPEIKVLVPLVRRLGSVLIGMVSEKDSFLGKNSDHILHAKVDEEACPNNLAPTTSTTAALALGDAVAVCLLKSKEFGKQDFAKYHPGGALGKQLYLKVSDIYSENEVPVVNEDATLNEVILEISSKRLGATAVVNSNAELVGMVTDGDLRRMLSEGITNKDVMAKDIMTSNPKTIEGGIYAVKALNIMQENNITQLIVSSNKQVIGFVHLHDLIKEGLV